MATPKFATVKGSGTIASSPYYVGLVQHESSMTKRETYGHLAEKLKFSQANIKAALLGLGKILKVFRLGPVPIAYVPIAQSFFALHFSISPRLKFLRSSAWALPSGLRTSPSALRPPA